MKITFWLLAFWMAWTAPALGVEHRNGDLVEVRMDETVSGDLFAGAREVRILGMIDGDVYAGGGSLLVEGEVADDLHAGCRTLRMTGKVGDGLIFFGQKLFVDGEVAGDLKAFGAEVRIGPQALIHGDVFVGAGKLTMEGGLIEGNLKGFIRTVLLDGRINGDTSLNVGHIRYGEAFQGAGRNHLTLRQPLDEDQAGRLPGNLEIEVRAKPRTFPFFGFFGLLWSMTTVLLVGLIFVLFFKHTTRDFLEYAKSGLQRHTGLGFLYLAATPLAVVILLLLIFTIPIALIVTALYLIALYVGGVLASLAIGEWLLDRLQRQRSSRSLIPPLIIGVIFVEIITRIPIIGALIGLVIVCYGLGSLVHFLWNYRRMPETAVEA